MFRRLALVPAAVIAILGLGGIVAAGLAQPQLVIRADSVYANVDLDLLRSGAESIVIVEYTGRSERFWNSDTGQPWTPEVGRGVQAWIYRDDEFTVVRSIAGADLGEEVTVRGIGGTIDNTTVEFDGQVDWRTGERYLLFLSEELTPFESGSEVAWTVLWQGHGTFVEVGDRWHNVERTLTTDLETLIASP